MRRHGAFLRLGALEGEDPNDDLWALQAKQLKQMGPPSQERNTTNFGQYFRKTRVAFLSTCRSILNFQISGRTTTLVLCLFFLTHFRLFQGPTFTHSTAAPQKRMNVMKKLLYLLKVREGGVLMSHSEIPSGLCQQQRTMYELASNLSAVHGPMVMASMWNGWKVMQQSLARKPALEPYVNSGLLMWLELMESLEAKDIVTAVEPNGGSSLFGMRVCPESLSSITGTELEATNNSVSIKEYSLPIPCGVTHNTTITIVGKPIDNFYIKLMKGTDMSLEAYKMEVKLHGDGAPCIRQTQPMVTSDALEEPYVEQCPASNAKPPLLPDGKPMPLPPTKYVDSLHPCSDALGKPQIIINSTAKDQENIEDVVVGHFPGLNVLDESGWFPFNDNHPFVLSISFGMQGYHIHVDGKYVCAFLYPSAKKYELLQLESVSGLLIGGDVLPMSVIAKGLAMPEQSIPIPVHLKAPSTALDNKHVELLIGVASKSTEFEHRMGVRRSWAQYPLIHSGRVLLRFFVGLTDTKKVNRRIFKEATSFKDIVILPFVDEPAYTVLKTAAMCSFMTKYTRAPYLMKTDDDTFVRVDEVLEAITTTEITQGLVYGSIEDADLSAHNKSTLWYSSKKEWWWSSYPVFPCGPGYVISRDIADFITHKYEDERLELFRIENVAIGIWADLYQRQYLHHTHFVNDREFLNKGCAPGYSVTHNQNLQQMLCLWKHLQKGEGPMCCDELGDIQDLIQTNKTQRIS